MVSVEQDVQDTVKRIVKAVNSVLEHTEDGGFTDVDEIKAVIFIVMREDTAGGLLFGRTSHSKTLRTVLEFLADNGVISEHFALATFTAWLEIDDEK